MKKFLLLSTALLLTLCAKADDQMLWGYFLESDEVQYLSTGKAETYHCAIYIPENHEIVGPSTIMQLRTSLTRTSNISMCKIWISKSLPSSPDNADYVQDIEVNRLTNGVNNFNLNTPYVVNNKGIYVGFSFTTRLPLGACIPCGGNGIPNAFFLKTSSTITTWQTYTSYGKMAIQLLLQGGTYPDNSATPSGFGPLLLKPGESKDVDITITNQGRDAIHNISYTISSDESTSDEKTVTTDPTTYGATTSIPITFKAGSTEGTSINTLTITKVNGKANTSKTPSVTGKVITASNMTSWPRNVLIEEFTTENCGYCPDAAAGLSSFMTTYPDLASRTAVACHHSGYYDDWLTIDASLSYEWFYNGSTYAPAFMWDRYTANGDTPVESRPSNAAGYKAKVESRIADPSYANIELSADFNSDKSAISVTADCERSWEFSRDPARITLFLTEDNITAKSQSGASGTFIHQHALRAVNETWGSPLEWNADKAQYTYTFNVNKDWKTDDLKVIAFISEYNSEKPSDCKVENAVVVKPSSASSVNTITTVNSHDVKRYTIDGRQISAPQRGLNIIKTAEGKTVKVLVR